MYLGTVLAQLPNILIGRDKKFNGMTPRFYFHSLIVI